MSPSQTQGRRDTWIVESVGASALGNITEPEPGGVTSSDNGLQCEAAHQQGPPDQDFSHLNLCDLLKCEDLPAYIHPSEVAIISDFASGINVGKWEELLVQDCHKVSRVKGDPLSGPITFMVESTLKGVPLALASDQCNNFPQRTAWDRHIHSVVLHDVQPGNTTSVPSNLFYFVLRAAPFQDRDFVARHILGTSTSGNGYFTYMRDTRHVAYPPGQKRRIRGSMPGCLNMIRRDPTDPENSCIFVNIVRVDLKLPFVPLWLVNTWAPMKYAAFTKSLQEVCIMKRERHLPPCLTALFARHATVDKENVVEEGATTSVDDMRATEDLPPSFVREPELEYAAAPPCSCCGLF
mmetsp:Transcript_32387/g.69024  ORF Transcript_32387/g.69024 Transcript_32387/m.69024 type:complete len:351 (+) Transcript_32387:53-1105(+)